MPTGPGFEALRRGRLSIPTARYFLTLGTDRRQTGLSSPRIAAALRSEIDALDADASWYLHGAVIMPDHLHFLATLGSRLTLGQAIGRLKAKTRALLATTKLRWQGNYFDHRLRPDDSIESVLRYMFLNPYRGQLLPPTERYPWFWLGAEESEWFHATPADQLPQIE